MVGVRRADGARGRGHESTGPAVTRGTMPGLSLPMLLSSLGTSIAGITLPELVRVFGASFGDVQWVVTAYLAAQTALLIVAGRLGDRVGRRRLLLAGIGLFTAASAACALAATLPALVAARAVQGLGAAIMMSLSMALVGDTVPRGRTGSAMGLLGMMSAVGTTLGPSAGGVLVSSFGWRAVHWFHVPLGVAAMVLAMIRLPDARPRVTLPGATRGDTGPVLLAAVGPAVVMSAIVSAVIMTTLVVGPFHLQRALGLSAGLAGIAMSVGPLAAALASVPAGRLVDRAGAPRATTTGLVVMAAACAPLSFMPERTGVAGYVAPLAVITMGYALFQAANNTRVLAAVHPDRRGTASGILSFSRNVGLIAGTSVMGAVFALAVGAGGLATAAGGAIAHGTRIAFAVATALVTIALGMSVLVAEPAGHRGGRRGDSKAIEAPHPRGSGAST